MLVLPKIRVTEIGIDGLLGSHFGLTICRDLLLLVLIYLELAAQSHLRKEVLAVKQLRYQWIGTDGHRKKGSLGFPPLQRWHVFHILEFSIDKVL